MVNRRRRSGIFNMVNVIGKPRGFEDYIFIVTIIVLCYTAYNALTVNSTYRDSLVSYGVGYSRTNSGNSSLATQVAKTRFSDIDYLWPVPERQNISSGFGTRYVNGIYGNHKGIDVSGGGQEGHDIVAVEEGEVIFSGVYKTYPSSTYGKIVQIRHPDGNETRYAHNSVNLVSTGDKVTKGQVIAKMGNTGRSTGPHLHFEIRVDGQAIDPLQLLPDYKEIPTQVLYKAKVNDKAADLNIRRTISYTNEYNIVTVVPSGTVLEILREDNHPRVLDKSISVLVRTPDGKIGYCKKSYLDKI